MDKRGPPKDIDIPSTIVVYVLVCLLGIGMCFCLKRANRLLPNPLSFPLRPRGSDRERRRGYDQADEEFGDPESREGLLARQDDFDNDEEDDDPHRLPPRSRYHSDDEEEEAEQQQTRTTTADTRQSEEEFGDMQGAPGSTQLQAAEEAPSSQAQQKRTPVFNIADEEDEDEPSTK